MKISILLFVLLLMTILGALGGVFFKLYSAKGKLFLLTGLCFYGLGALLNIVLLKYLPYTVVFPANALTYMWAIVFAKMIFKEKIGLRRYIGAGFIIAGVIFLVY